MIGGVRIHRPQRVGSEFEGQLQVKIDVEMQTFNELLTLAALAS